MENIAYIISWHFSFHLSVEKRGIFVYKKNYASCTFGLLVRTAGSPAAPFLHSTFVLPLPRPRDGIMIRCSASIAPLFRHCSFYSWPEQLSGPALEVEAAEEA
jgi:hypothetical protein